MRVYHLIKSLGRGGAEMLLPEGIRATPDITYEVGYFLPHKDALVGRIEASGAQVTCFDATKPGSILRRVPRVVRAIKRFQPDVVHCHLPLAGVAGRLAGKIAGVPVVYTEHNLQPRYHPLTFRANRLTWPMQSKVLACSADVARSIHEHVGDHVPVQVVQNGVTTEHFQRDEASGHALRLELGIPLDAPVMSTIAVFRTQKRLSTWLEVAKRVLASVPDAHFLLVGDGPLREEVDATIARLGLGERVHRPGLIEDVLPWLSASDLYVMSSEFEGLPIALLEAMSTSLPAVCTAVGGIDEVIRPGVEGALVPGDNPMGLVEPIVHYLTHSVERLEAAGAARERVVSAFGMARMMGEVEAIYREVAHGR